MLFKKKIFNIDKNKKGLAVNKKRKTQYLFFIILIFSFIGAAIGSYFFLLKDDMINTSFEEVNETKVVYLKIGAMTCGGCSYKINEALQETNGIFSLEINLSTASSVVKYDPEKIDKETIADIITNSGYPARIISSEEEIENIASISEPTFADGRRSGGCGCGCGG